MTPPPSDGRPGSSGNRRAPSHGDRGNVRRSGASAGADDPAKQLAAPLRRVLERLPEAQRMVLELRMGLADGHPHDLTDTARELGLSMSEAREIEQRAFAHIRETIPPKQLRQLQRYLT